MTEHEENEGCPIQNKNHTVLTTQGLIPGENRLGSMKKVVRSRFFELKSMKKPQNDL